VSIAYNGHYYPWQIPLVFERHFTGPSTRPGVEKRPFPEAKSPSGSGKTRNICQGHPPFAETGVTTTSLLPGAVVWETAVRLASIESQNIPIRSKCQLAEQ